MWDFQDATPMKISNIWYKNSQVLWRLKWVFTLLLPEVYSENWITPLWRETEERGESERRETETERSRDGEGKMEFAPPCEASNLEVQFSEQTSGPSTQMEPRLAPKWELLYRMLPWQQLNQLMMWGSLIVTNTVTETWLSSCLGKSTQSTYRPILFPQFTVPLSVQLPHEGQTSVPYFYAASEATCVNLCGPFEAALICSIKSSKLLMSEKAKASTLEPHH